MTESRFSSAEVGPRDRLPAIRHAWTHLMTMEMEPRGARTPALSLRGRQLPGLGLATFTGTAASIRRTERQAEAMGDEVVICVARHANVRIRDARGHDQIVASGGVHVWRANRPMTCEVDRRYEAVLVSLPRSSASAHGELDRVLRAGGLPGPNPARDLLMAYAESVLRIEAMSPATERLCATHLTELALLSLTGLASQADPASVSSVRAARLRAIKEDIAATVAHAGFSAEWMAARHGISSRYMRALFEDEQTTFTDHVLNERLRRAHRLLLAPGSRGRSIAAIAYASGFGDLSHFNRAFRRRFGATPSEVRGGGDLPRSKRPAPGPGRPLRA